MGIISKSIHEIIDAIDDIAIFIISFALFLFIVGEFFATAYRGRPEFWYPMYLFLLVLVAKVLKDVSKATGKKAEKKEEKKEKK